MGKNNIIERWPGFTRKMLGSGSSGLATYHSRQKMLGTMLDTVECSINEAN